MPRVSVIIPIYGVEEYIVRCANSLFSQTLDDMEYIFVDDCSPDRSIDLLKNVLENYPNRKPQTRIERMPKNSGLAAVRKYGASLASGDYMIACDSDDYVEREMYETMYSFAVQNEFDLVQCDIDLVDDNGVIRTLSSPIVTPSSQELKDMIIDGNIAASLCNKLVRRSIYQDEDVIFPVAGMDEDNTMSCQLAFYANKLGYINKPFYKAYFNRESMSRIPGEAQIYKRYQEALSNSQIAVDFLKAHGYSDDSIAVIKAKIRPKNALWPLVKNRRYIKEWRSVYPEIDYRILINKKISTRMKVKFLLVLTRVVLLRH